MSPAANCHFETCLIAKRQCSDVSDHIANTIAVSRLVLAADGLRGSAVVSGLYGDYDGAIRYKHGVSDNSWRRLACERKQNTSYNHNL